MGRFRHSLRVFGAVAFWLLASASALPSAAGESRVGGPRPSAAEAPGVETEARVIVKYRADASSVRALSVAAGAAASSATAAAVSVSSEAPPQHARLFASRFGLALADGRPNGPRSQLIRATGIGSADLAARLAAQPEVEYAVVDQRVWALRLPNDTLFAAGQSTTPVTGQWYLRKPGGDGEVASINAESAWDVTTGLASVVVAVIDTGITAHPDLAAKLLPGYDFITDAATANDGGGPDSDPTDTGDGITAAETNDPMSQFYGCGALDASRKPTLAEPNSWHGTQTAGLIGAATNNATGMASVGWNVMLLPLRALGKCGGSETDVTTAIQWAAGIAIPGLPTNPNKAGVINLSLGGKTGVACDKGYQDAINAAIGKGVVVVAAAGNDGLALGSPANCAGVIAVAGVRHAGTKVGYSDLGSNVTIAAPAGNCVNTTGTCLYPLITTSNSGAYTAGSPIYTDGDTHVSLGTSFAAPLVTGTVALMLSARPSLTPSQVAAALASTARPFPSSGAAPIQQTNNGPFVPVAACMAPSGVAQGYECYCTTATCGAGLLDAGAAVLAVAPTTASVGASAASVTVGGPVSFDGSASSTSGSLTLVGYQWAITSGAGVASLTGATNQPTVSAVTTAVGSFTVTLTVTDSLGRTAIASSTVTVNPVPAPASSGGGGGAVAWGWLLGVMVAVAALEVERRRAGRRRSPD